MRKTTLTKILLTFMIAGFGLEAYADTQAELVFRTSVPRASSIKKLRSGSTPITVNPDTGALTGGELQAAFELDSNVIDENHVFVMTSSVQTLTGQVSGYDGSGNLAFTNISNLPSSEDVSEALSHSGNNRNVIVYPVTVTTTSPIESEFQAGYSTYGNCYVININGAENGTVTQKVNSTPITNTYHPTRDTAGTYRAVITLTAVSE